MGKIKGILFAVRHREILMIDLVLYYLEWKIIWIQISRILRNYFWILFFIKRQKKQSYRRHGINNKICIKWIFDNIVVVFFPMNNSLTTSYIFYGLTTVNQRVCNFLYLSRKRMVCIQSEGFADCTYQF